LRRSQLGIRIAGSLGFLDEIAHERPERNPVHPLLFLVHTPGAVDCDDGAGALLVVEVGEEGPSGAALIELAGDVVQAVIRLDALTAEATPLLSPVERGPAG
jgi:hypothetical protein